MKDDAEALALADEMVGLFFDCADLQDHFALVDANQRPITRLKKNAPALWRDKARPAIVASAERNGFVARPGPPAKASDAAPIDERDRLAEDAL